MATYNKPGVYVEETLTPNIPSSGTNSTTVATFIGFADRGPTTVVDSKAYGVPTRVTSPGQFYTLFSFNNTPAPFSSTIATKIGSQGDALKYAVQSFFDNGGSEAYILRDLYTDATTASITLADNSSVISQANTWTFAGGASASAVSITSTANEFSGIEPNRVVYFSGITASGYTTLNNKFWVVKDVSTDGLVLTVVAKGLGTAGNTAQTLTATAPITVRGAVTPANGATNKTLKITANSHGVWGNYLWAEIKQGTAQYTFDLNLYYNPAAVTTADLTSANKVDFYTGLSMDPTSPQYFVKKINGVSPWITVSDLGQANIVATGVTGTINTNTLTLSAANANIRKGMVVTGAGIASGTAPTVVTNISGATVTLSAANTAAVVATAPITFSSAVGYADLPVFTNYWSSTYSDANFKTDDYSFVWNTANISSGNAVSPVANQTISTLKVNAVKLASLSGDVTLYPTITNTPTSNINTAKSLVVEVTTGAEGSTASDLALNVLPRLDAITNGMVINYPNKVDSTSVNALTKYAYTRGDSFVVIDTEVTNPGPNGAGKSVKDAIAAGSGYNVNPNYGAVYYPAISVKDPSTAVSGKTVLIPPGGAVVAAYLGSDASRGIHKAPAGVSAVLSNAVGAYALTNDDFNLVNSSTPYLNIIRQISGNYCIMGARTLSSQNIDTYVSIRRTLNYLSKALKAQTQFAVFEPNDSYLWTRVSSVANNFLYAFWKQNGLAGQSPEDAYYVKCDSDINTPATIATGQLNIEVGVALQYPAEFVVIRIGQIDGGATATTSI